MHKENEENAAKKNLVNFASLQSDNENQENLPKPKEFKAKWFENQKTKKKKILKTILWSIFAIVVLIGLILAVVGLEFSKHKDFVDNRPVNSKFIIQSANHTNIKTKILLNARYEIGKSWTVIFLSSILIIIYFEIIFFFLW